jgi:hypothetical protein
VVYGGCLDRHQRSGSKPSLVWLCGWHSHGFVVLSTWCSRNCWEGQRRVREWLCALSVSVLSVLMSSLLITEIELIPRPRHSSSKGIRLIMMCQAWNFLLSARSDQMWHSSLCWKVWDWVTTLGTFQSSALFEGFDTLKTQRTEASSWREGQTHLQDAVCRGFLSPFP